MPPSQLASSHLRLLLKEVSWYSASLTGSAASFTHGWVCLVQADTS
ncbi:hypothetical protein ACFPN2_22780 [Steroidobacter flavus]|uniref:Uncharacterized protein n=1 Tax=Steroidobacter flavus TaxID=1842136 RepID=A0ABV8SYU2_9GAMM